MSTTPRPARRGGINGHNGGWKDAENDALTRLYPTANRAQVEAALPGRTWNAMHLHAATLNLERRRYWNEARLATLTEHYPAHGAAYVAQLLDCPVAKVTKQASLQGIVRQYAPKPIPTPKPPKAVKPTPQPKPKPQPKPVVEPVSQHQPARLSNLIAQKSLQKKKKASGSEREVSVAYIKTLPIHHPERLQYSLGGERAVLQYREQQMGQAA